VGLRKTEVITFLTIQRKNKVRKTTLTDVARLISRSPTYVWSMERGHVVPKDEHLPVLAEIYETTVDVMCKEMNWPAPATVPAQAS
jgi:hypothetical protein